MLRGEMRCATHVSPDAPAPPPDGRPALTPLERRIGAIVRREFPAAFPAGMELGAESPILGKGLLDSVEALVLVVALEAELGIQFEDDELSVEIFASLRTLADHAGGKLPTVALPATTVGPVEPTVRGGERGAGGEPAGDGGDSVPDLLELVARRHAGRVAVAGPEASLTYGRLHERVAALSDHLGDLGVARGQLVVLLIPNGVAFVVAFLAVARRGAVVLPLNSRYREAELAYYLADAEPALLVTVAEHEALSRSAAATATPSPRLLVLDDEGRPVPENRGVTPTPSASRHGALAIRPHDPVLCLYSSGSTGKPKRVVRTHAQLLFELSRLGQALGLTADDRLLGVVPFSHVNGLVRTMLGSLSVGATLVPLAEFRRRDTAATIASQRISVIVAVPFVFDILGQGSFEPPVDFSSLRLCVSASAPLPVAASRRFHERHGLFVRQLYGCTETGTVAFHGGADVEDTLDSVGRPLDGVEIQILRADGSVAGVDETGDVAIKSPAAFTGYHGDDGDGARFRDGYFVTGDVGRVDGRGLLYLAGRTSWFINRAGYKINPWELETLLLAHPRVEDVAVIGVPTPHGDEMVKAVIAARGACSAEDILQFCRGKVADFKLPGAIEFRERLPRGATGKILRAELG